jgi:hypothetical protein
MIGFKMKYFYESKERDEDNEKEMYELFSITKQYFQ